MTSQLDDVTKCIDHCWLVQNNDNQHINQSDQNNENGGSVFCLFGAISTCVDITKARMSHQHGCYTIQSLSKGYLCCIENLEKALQNVSMYATHNVS